MNPSTKDKIYSVAKIATIVDLLRDEGIPAKEALADISLSPEQLRSPATKVSAAQVLQSYRNAIKLSTHPRFAYHAGLKSCVSTYGIYGLAILSCTDFRNTMAFAAAYHQLATPMMEICFKEEGSTAVWIVTPTHDLDIDDRLYRFIVEFQMAVHLSLHRNIMGPAFKPALIDYALRRPHDDGSGTAFFDCPILYDKPENRFTFDAAWLDRRPDYGNELTYAELRQLCDGLLKQLKLGAGVAGEVRGLILANLSMPIEFKRIAKYLNMSERSLRRRLQEEGTSFRQLADELKAQIAIKYIRDTDLSVEEIAFALGFGDAASFRHAFRRWTNATPQDYRKSGIRRET
ncbi:transcriptional regulator, AraC family protein [Nitrobacter sp. Nb-311A]|uniref:AraC family transcriptional regulator n=1 Tax=unclassified Nitrobacter TaxID=2620411 RepID=UPI0000685DFB|nr:MULTISPECIES: AraC family transcriptional regulator [unclassified Nitrobacter]EAQ35138.1 transcriptional regulator, AraC family protein [Nitrobacter sp. Nb-311A]MCB1393904.1 AraC family transcriptional regulator [Nitrobacter sp.]MCV0388069.1 AraC family transcriptional regulator [Nitrobacter sp.]